MFKVFVYGTLMRGFGNYNNYLEGKVLSCVKGKTSGKLYHLPAGYPGMIDGNDIIKGEVVEIKDEIVECLDELEGYNGEGENNVYDRIERGVKTEDGNSIICQVYLYRNINYLENCGTYIPHGDWKEFMIERKEKEYIRKEDS